MSPEAVSPVLVSWPRSLITYLAMAAGKAVVATGWSANLDFMTATNSALVDYALEPVQDSQGIYAGGRWADADVSDAAAVESAQGSSR